jgi:hypothetical protein
MPSHSLLRDFAALNEGLCDPSLSDEANFRLVTLTDKLFKALIDDEVARSLDPAELLE